MNRLFASGIALALMTGAVLAQAAAPAPGKAPPPAAGDAAAPGTPPPPPGGPRAGLPHPGGPGGMDDGGPDGPHGHRPPPPPRGAHIHLQRGDLMLDVKCADDEPMKSCADTALQMLDHLQAAPKAP